MFTIVQGMLVLLPGASGSAPVETDVWDGRGGASASAPAPVVCAVGGDPCRAAESAWTPVGSLGASTGGDAGRMHTLHELVGAGGGRGDDEDPAACGVGHGPGSETDRAAGSGSEIEEVGIPTLAGRDWHRVRLGRPPLRRRRADRLPNPCSPHSPQALHASWLLSVVSRAPLPMLSPFERCVRTTVEEMKAGRIYASMSALAA